MKKVTINPSEKITWIKKGGGSFRMADGRIIKPLQKFQASLDEIPIAFRDMILPYDSNVVVKTKPEQNPLPQIPEGNEAKYTVKEREDAVGWFDVLNSDGKPQNKRALREDKAKELCNAMNS